MYNQIADACFQVGTGVDQIVVRNIPFIWDGKSDRDQQGALAVAYYIGKHDATEGKPITLLWVSCREDKDNA
jgi:hypothetical protein